MTGADPFDPTDEQLLEEARRDPASAASREAASRLFERHQRRVYLWCYRYVRDNERALELAQEALLSAYRGLAGFEGRSRFSSWLFAIARNRCLNAMAAPSLLRDDSAELERLPDSDPTPDRVVEDREDEEQLRRLMMAHLDESEREALWLRCMERMPVDEIGRVMRLENASGARALLQRARRRLRAALERRPREMP
jgi:RNA polymerase sigma-70 factor (ECF subfamily)